MQAAHAQRHSRPAPRSRFIACAIVLALLPLVAYSPAYNAGFYSDDESHIVRNERLRTAQGLGEIWSDLRGTDDLYYPLTFTTYWIDYQLWGTDPAGYHSLNIILHALNSLLVWLVFRRLRIPAAWIAAAVFALHPVNVESVAWVTERRNTLSALFYLLSALAYLRYRPVEDDARWPRGLDNGGDGVRGPSDEHTARPRGRGAYVASLLFFLAALLSKTATLSLPAALLLVTWWKKGRVTRADCAPLVPFFALGIALSLWTTGLERSLIERGGPGWGDYTVLDRVIIAGHAVWFYLGKFLLPTGLSFVYPKWSVGVQPWTAFLYPLGVVALFAALFAARGRIGRGPLAALLFFVGTLLPVLGFVDYFYMMLSLVADRFLYLPGLGVIAAVVGYAGALWTRLGVPARRTAAVLAAAVLAVLAVATWQRASVFEDAETLYRDVLEKDRDSWVGHYSLGVVYAAGGRPADALPHLETAARTKTNFPSIRGYLGVVYSQLGRHDDALRAFDEALRQNPEDPEIRTNLGVALVSIGRYDEAIDEYGKALSAAPGYPPALRNFSRIVVYRIDELRKAGDNTGAARFGRKAISLARSVGADSVASEIEKRLPEIAGAAD